MKRSFGPRKTPSSLSDSIHQQLNMYALAPVVGAVILLALAQPSEAKIVYTPTNVVINPGNLHKLDLNHDGLTDFAIDEAVRGDFECKKGSGKMAFVTVTPSQGNATVVATDGFLAALDRGTEVGPNRHYISGEDAMVNVASGYFNAQCYYLHRMLGHWVNVSNRYLGLEFQINGKIHYGWAKLSVHVGYVYINATLTGYAYENIAGKSIKAGQTNSSVDASIGDDPGSNVEDEETLDEKPISDFLLRDPDIPAAFAIATSNPESTCTNCLIRRCLVRNNKLFGGYCLEGARGGICHESYDPTHCPSGKQAKRSVQKQCGPSKFTVDDLRPCS
jgi:hypothetical protein